MKMSRHRQSQDGQKERYHPYLRSPSLWSAMKSKSKKLWPAGAAAASGGSNDAKAERENHPPKNEGGWGTIR